MSLFYSSIIYNKTIITPQKVEMPNITENVSFDTVAREIRCKWTPDDDKKSLVACQKVLEAHLSAFKSIPGRAKVQRVVCGGCFDFKVIVSMRADAFAKWEAEAFKPEKEVLDSLKKIYGVQAVETQTFTLMEM